MDDSTIVHIVHYYGGLDGSYRRVDATGTTPPLFQTIPKICCRRRREQ